jgi:glycosyltransferase involved in cell wall biosynthesis
MKRILFTHYGENQIRGSERCLLDLIKHLDKGLFLPIVWCNSELLAAEVARLDIKVIRSDFSILFGWLSPHYDFAGFLSVVTQGLDIVRKENIDLLHANGGAPNQWLNLVARIEKLPLVSHLHSRYPLRDRLVLGLHNTSLTVGVSQPVLQRLIEDGMEPERAEVVLNGIDNEYQDQVEAIDLRQLLGLEQRDFIAITVGSLIHRKGVDLLVQTVSWLVERKMPIHLVIVGDGPEKEALQELVRVNRLQSRVHFLGERTDVAGLLRGGADVLVSGAREEVFGLTLAEANLAALPVIAPCVGGIPEVIENHESGILVLPENFQAIGHAILRLHETPRLKIDLGKAGRSRVLDKFTIKKNAARFQDIYLELIEDQEKHLGFFKNSNLPILMKMVMRVALIGLRKMREAIGFKSPLAAHLSREQP